MSDVAFDASGRVVVIIEDRTSHDEHVVHLYDSTTGEQRWPEVERQLTRTRCLAFGTAPGGGARLLAGTTDGYIRAFADDDALVGELRAFPYSEVSTLTMNDRGDIAAGSGHGEIVIAIGVTAEGRAHLGGQVDDGIIDDQEWPRSGRQGALSTPSALAFCRSWADWRCSSRACVMGDWAAAWSHPRS